MSKSDNSYALPDPICVMQVKGWDNGTPGVSVACPIHIPGHIIPEPVEAPKGRYVGIRWCKCGSTNLTSNDCPFCGDSYVEPVEAVSTTPKDCGGLGHAGCGVCDVCRPKVSTPLPQQDHIGHEHKMVKGEEKSFPCALPQQEEPATLIGQRKEYWIDHINDIFSVALPGEDIPECVLVHGRRGDPTSEAINWAKMILHAEPNMVSAPIAPLLGQDEPALPSLPKKVRGEDWAKYWGRAFDERTKSLTQALTSLATAQKQIAEDRDTVNYLGKRAELAEASLAADSQKEDKGCDWEDNERAYRAGSKIDEERMISAAYRSGILYVGCDTPEALADAIITAEAKLAEAQKISDIAADRAYINGARYGWKASAEGRGDGRAFEENLRSRQKLINEETKR